MTAIGWFRGGSHGGGHAHPKVAIVAVMVQVEKDEVDKVMVVVIVPSRNVTIVVAPGICGIIHQTRAHIHPRKIILHNVNIGTC